MKKQREHDVYDYSVKYWPEMIITGSIVAGVFAVLFWLGSL